MKKIIIGLFLILLFFSTFVFYWAIFLPKDYSASKEVVFSIKKGEGSKEIAANLEKEGLIKDKNIFLLYALVKGKIRNMQSGDYLFSPAMKAPQILDKLNRGDVIKEKITIIEGWNLRDIGWYFENKGMFQAEELFELVGFPAVDYRAITDLPVLKNFSEDFVFLKDKPNYLNLEGYLFPDTYELNRGESLEEITQKMLDNFDKKVYSEIKDDLGKQDKSLFEIITMASLIEREARTPEDKKMVSGILWKRLSIAMPLQVDATVNYITGRKDTRVTTEETKIDSPYNTYKYKGLPLGPVANPGLESIKAALYPEISSYLYYLSTPEGEIIFSKTLQEHNIAKAKYLK